MTLLVTGFDPWDDGINASRELVQSLADDLPDELQAVAGYLRFEILPADSDRLADTVTALLARYEPRAWIMFGQARGRNRVCLERVAINVLDFDDSDAAGNRPQDLAVVADGPAAYRSTLSRQGQLVDKLNAMEIPAALSSHAGTFLCNQALYLALHFSTGSALQCGFVHVPPLPSQAVQQWPDSPHMPLAMTCRAATTLLSTVHRQVFGHQAALRQRGGN